MRKNGFTLIELIMVISIIAVLAGLLIPIIGYARTLSKNAKCTSQLGTIKASLSLYKDANGFYPEAFGAPDVYAAEFKSGTTYKPASAINWDAIARALLEQLRSVDRGSYSSENSLRDPFTGGGTTSKFIRYRPAKFYPLTNPTVPDVTLMIDSYEPPNPDSYQLWSAGADGKDQYGDRDRTTNRKSDDLTNWTTP